MNERLPIAAMDFGTKAIGRVLARLGEAARVSAETRPRAKHSRPRDR